MKTLEQAAKTYVDERCRAVNIYGELDTHKTQARFLDILSHFEAGAQWERERSKVLEEAITYYAVFPLNGNKAREALANYRPTGWTESNE